MTVPCDTTRFPLRRVGYVQDERYIAGEHMDVRRDCVNFARLVGWVIYYPRVSPSWDETVRYGPGRPLDGFPVSPSLTLQVTHPTGCLLTLSVFHLYDARHETISY